MKSIPKYHLMKLNFTKLDTVFCAILTLIIFQSCKRQESEQIFELPLTYHDGYGPFALSFDWLDPENANDNSELKKAYQKVTGIPKNWSSVKKGHAESDFAQLLFQNFKVGNVSRERLSALLTEPDMNVDTNMLSPKPIKCVVNVIWGADEAGNWAAMIDTDNDLDFSDEVPFAPEFLAFKGERNLTSTSNQRMVTFEAFRNGKVVSYQVPMVVRQTSERFVYKFLRYATASLIKDNKVYKIFIESSRPSFDYAGIAYLGEDSSKILTSNQLVRPGKNLELGDLLHTSKYKNLGVNRYNQTLKLQGVPSDKVEYILQEGYQFQDFEGKEFTTGEQISTNDLRGKYVYIDFWATWCKGCVEDMPKLNELYRKSDKTKIAFIGVAQDNSKSLKKGIAKYKIEWPQMLSSENGNLVEKCKVTGFPTTVLLDKTGRVIAVNLRNEELEKTIEKLK